MQNESALHLRYNIKIEVVMESFQHGGKNNKAQGRNYEIVSNSHFMSETSRRNAQMSRTATKLNGTNKNECCIEKRGLLENREVKGHRSLSFFRVIRGISCLLILVSTAFMTLVFLAPVSSVILRLFSIHYSREVTSFLFGHWLEMWPFLFEKINNTKVIFSGHSVASRERILLISNHRTEVDWMYLWDFALRKKSLGYIKYILKSSVRNAPIFGWGFHILEFILVERKWEQDKPVIESMLSTFKDPQDPLWLVLFPEGTDFTEQKCRRSQQFAEEHGLPVLNNVLLPRTKGFASCLALLRGSLDAVYDVTIGYNYRCPTFMDNVFGMDPAEVHIHVHRVPINEMPISEDAVACWLNDAFRRKDELLSTFSVQGCFPDSNVEGELPTFRCFLNFALMVIATALIFTFTIVFSTWLKIYVALSCAYFAGATYFNFWPTPVFGRLTGRMSHGKTHK